MEDLNDPNPPQWTEEAANYLNLTDQQLMDNYDDPNHLDTRKKGHGKGGGKGKRARTTAPARRYFPDVRNLPRQ